VDLGEAVADADKSKAAKKRALKAPWAKLLSQYSQVISSVCCLKVCELRFLSACPVLASLSLFFNMFFYSECVVVFRCYYRILTVSSEALCLLLDAGDVIYLSETKLCPAPSVN